MEIQHPPSSNLGIIIPPPKRREIIDKTAAFVARQGKQMEEEILNNQQASNAATFTFLLEDDPFHAYYLSKIEEFRAGQPFPQAQQTQIPQQQAPQPSTTTVSSAPILRASSLVEAMKASSKKKGQDPLPFEFILEKPADASRKEFELIKLCAQFAATDGKKFETDLFHAQKNNLEEYGFLHKEHSHHSYYTELIRCYRKLLTPEGIPSYIAELAKSESVLLERAVHRFEFRRDEALKRVETDEKKAEERAKFLEIDWNDFVVVETIRFDDNQDESALQQKGMVELLVSEAADAARKAVVESSEQDDEDVGEIRRDYQVQPTRATLNVPMVSIDGKRIVPASEMNEHVRVELLDPKWRVNQSRFEESQRKSNLDVSSNVSKNLSNLARARPDLFGGELEEAERREEEKRKKEAGRLVWDGNPLTADSVKAAAAVATTTTSASTISSLFATVSALPPPGVALPPPLPPAMPSQQLQQEEVPVESGNKRAKFSGGGYVVIVPSGGPVPPTDLSVQCSPSISVNEFKELVSAKLSNVAVSKFQLKAPDGKFLKNTDLLASLPEGATIELKWKTK